MTDKEKELQAEAIAYYRMRIEELKKACDETQELLDKQIEATYKLDKENAELKSIANFQTSSNMDRYFQLKRSKELLTKAKEIIKMIIDSYNHEERFTFEKDLIKAEQFLKEIEK